MIRRTYTMPPFTPRRDAKALAEPCGVQLIDFRTLADGRHRVEFEAADQAAFDALITDLAYGPDTED